MVFPDLGVWVYTLISVLTVSLISLIGILTLSIKVDKLKKVLIYVVSFSAGALFGDSFIHLLPEAVEETGFSLEIGISVIFGIIFFFVIEKFVHWQHCHHPITKDHLHPFSIMNLVGDGIHNFVDGLIIAASYLISFPIGIATTLAVLFHEIPQEIGDYGILIHGGFSKSKALFVNFGTALFAVLGAVIALAIGNYSENLILLLLPFAAGGFIYIAGSDLIPELHKSTKIHVSIIQIITFVLGVLVMAALLFFD